MTSFYDVLLIAFLTLITGVLALIVFTSFANIVVARMCASISRIHAKTAAAEAEKFCKYCGNPVVKDAKGHCMSCGGK
jgi:uncharacterized paraquat-inducible protein A